MNAKSPRILLALSLLGLLLLGACGTKPTPGEKDRDQGNQAIDQMPK